MPEAPHRALPAESFLEWAFLRWVLGPATRPEIVDRVAAQHDLDIDGRRYRLDYEITGRIVVRFSYDAIRADTERCVAQLQAVLARDPSLAALLEPRPIIETPEMNPDPVHALDPAPWRPGTPPASAAVPPVPERPSYYDGVRDRLEQKTLRVIRRRGVHRGRLVRRA